MPAIDDYNSKMLNRINVLCFKYVIKEVLIDE